MHTLNIEVGTLAGNMQKIIPIPTVYITQKNIKNGTWLVYGLIILL